MTSVSVCIPFRSEDPERVRMFFDEMTALGVEGMMLSPGYSYTKAPDQEHFLRRARTREMFARILSFPRRTWKFNQSPLFLEFLMGHREYQCTPWGNPTYNVFGWQKPCYLLQEGYAETFEELMKSTEWESYGTGRNEKCADCMVHCGYEASAVDDTFGSLRGFLATIRATIFGVKSKVKRSRETVPVPFSHGALSKPAPAPAAFAKELPVLGGHRQAS